MRSKFELGHRGAKRLALAFFDGSRSDLPCDASLYRVLASSTMQPDCSFYLQHIHFQGLYDDGTDGEFAVHELLALDPRFLLPRPVEVPAVNKAIGSIATSSHSILPGCPLFLGVPLLSLFLYGLRTSKHGSNSLFALV